MISCPVVSPGMTLNSGHAVALLDSFIFIFFDLVFVAHLFAELHNQSLFILISIISNTMFLTFLCSAQYRINYLKSRPGKTINSFP